MNRMKEYPKGAYHFLSEIGKDQEVYLVISDIHARNPKICKAVRTTRTNLGEVFEFGQDIHTVLQDKTVFASSWK